MRIHIVGASCVGSTTLGKSLSALYNIPYFDTDDYFWILSEVPFTLKRAPLLRNEMLKDDLDKTESYIVGGSLVSWGEEWKSRFDLVVFLYAPAEIRLARLKKREIERYGTAIYDNPERNLLFARFIEWASKYDDRDFTGRNIKLHEDWIESVKCTVLQIKGDTTVEERLKVIQKALNYYR